MVVSNRHAYLNDSVPCNKEEANESLVLHSLGVSKSFDRVLMKPVDRDVVIIATVAFQKIRSYKELWIKFGRGKCIKFRPVHEIVLHLGQC